MKFLFTCTDCDKTSFSLNDFIDVEINDDGVYELTCRQGHRSVLSLNEQPFEILFDLGSLALLDGYSREAVSSFAAAIERFYEFFVAVILKKNNIDLNEFNDTWKLVKNQSERQLGAFYFIYLNEFKKSPVSLEKFAKIGSKNLVEFRNDVIHKGHIPKYDDVLKYAEHLYNYMIPILRELKINYGDAIGLVTVNRKKMVPQEGSKMVAASIPTMIHFRLSAEEFGKMSFGESLDALRERMKYFYQK